MPLSASSLYRIASEVFGPTLADAGFKRLDRRTWLRRTKAQIREVVLFRPAGEFRHLADLGAVARPRAPRVVPLGLPGQLELG